LRISILIAAYNAEKYLTETIESVLAQSVTDWELIVVDDGSRDGTAQIVQSFADRDPRIRLVCQPNRGAVIARNQGIREACPASDFVILLDHDDTWTPDALATLITALEANPQAVGAHGIALYTTADMQPLWPEECPVAAYRRYRAKGARLVRVPPDCPTTFEMMVTWCCLPTPGIVLIRHNALRAAGLFDESNARALDWDLWLQLTRQGELTFVPKVILNYRQHTGSVAYNAKWLHSAIYAARRRLWNAPQNSVEQRRIVHHSYRPIERYLLAEKFGYVREYLGKGELKTAFRQSLYALRHGLHYLRGHP
jgi:glycosyltransferase involved in cell wall biosynthesis